jgi:fibronectin-binding autotransporter adhesin
MPTILKLQGQIDLQGANYAVPSLLWNGLSVNSNNWSTSNNWDLLTPPTTNNILHFAGSTRIAPINDLAIDTTINSIYFNSGAASFQISGNRFILGSTPFRENSIRNNSSNIQQINNDIVLGSDNGTINCNTAAILLRGNISGSGSLTKLGLQTLSLSGNNSYTGNTFISAGVISVLNDNPFGTGTVFCSGQSGGISVSVNAAPINTIINNSIFINGERPSTGNNISCSKSATFNGLIVVGPSSRTNRLNVVSNATMTINGGISGLPGMGSILTTSGIGTYILSSVPIIFDNTNATPIYSSDGRETVIIAVSGNRFQNITTGGTLRTDVPFAINNDVVILGFARSGTISRHGRVNLNGNSQVFRNIRNSTAMTFADMSANNIFNNSSTFANLTANNTAASTYTGSISGNINLIKTGTGTLTLSGSTALGVGQRYTGFTAISAGTLTVRALSSNPSNKVNFASFTNTALTVDFAISPIAGETYILLPARTINSYPAVTLQNGGGTTGTYNSTNSTLTIS